MVLMHDQKSLAPKLFVLESPAVNRSEAKWFPSAPTLIFFVVWTLVLASLDLAATEKKDRATPISANSL
jgi:hypothetical protein